MKHLSNFLCVVLLFFALSLKGQVKTLAFEKSTGRPNVIIIMADDLDSRQLSCYGGKNIQTRNIDLLAKQGLKFNNMYASEAVCVPVRASLFTGLYPVRHGAFQNHKRVNNNLKSIAHYLPELGYKVGLTGKDHTTKPKNVFPFEIVEGFETNCVSPTDEYAMDSVRQYISRKDKPYCLFIMSTNPHKPWNQGDPGEFNAEKLILPPNIVDTKETRREFCNYLAEVRRLDNQVGDVMKLLKETGQEENTILIFLGEQGPQFSGGKWTCWDYGQKSSMIVRWPGKVKRGDETDAIVQYEDVLPTLIDIAGGAAVTNLDGKSFKAVLTGESRTHRDFAYGIYNNIPEGPAYPIRSIRDTRYKLILNLLPENKYSIKWYSVPADNGVWNSWLAEAEKSAPARFLTERITTRPAVELYDIRNDPWELNNLAAKGNHTKLINFYKTKLNEWMQQQGDEGASIDRVYQAAN